MQLLRIPEVAKRLGVSRSFAYELAERRAIPVVILNTAVRVPADALEQWIREHTELNKGAEIG